MSFKKYFQTLKSTPWCWSTTLNTMDFFVLIFGLSVAWTLFQFGMSYPFDSRLTGDAFEYMQIASRFEGLSSILNFMGERTVGMPFFNWLLKPNGQFLEPDNSMWVHRITNALFSLHIIASFIFIYLASRYAQLKSRWSLRFLFIIFISFPAFVGHTTTPLTDTLAVDLTLMMLLLFYYSMDYSRFNSRFNSNAPLTLKRQLVSSALTGFLLLFLILLRPAYLVQIVTSLLIIVLFYLFTIKENQIFNLIKLFFVLGVTFGGLFFVSSNCHSKFGAPFCLQNPKTFEPVRHAQMGLKGGRLLWSAEYPGNGEFPIVPDPLLKSNFYDRCQLKKIVGVNNDSLLGCLASKPQLLPVYIVKKWIGLFDHFRFQPYVELETPTWLKNLSRSYDLFAWVGFLFLVVYPFQFLSRIKFVFQDSSTKPHPVTWAYFIFVALMLSEHTILHPEDRFGLVAIPLALISFVKGMEYLRELYQTKQWKLMSFIMICSVIWIGIFIY